MTTKPAIVLASAAACALLACENDRSFVRLKVEAADSQGQAVAGAHVYVDGALVGQTNAKGVYAGEAKLPKHARLELKVAKDSAQFYYAPHFDTLTTGDDEIQALARKAVLYAVPKPGVADVLAETAAPAHGAAGDAAANANPDVPTAGNPVTAGATDAQDPAGETANALPAALADAAAPASGATGSTAQGETVEAIPGAAAETAGLPTIAGSAAASADPTAPAAAQNGATQAGASTAPQGSVLPTNTPALPSGNGAPANLTADALPPLADAPAHDLVTPLEDGAVPDAAPKAVPAAMAYNVHVFAERKPLAGVTVTYGFAEKGELRTACVTSPQGRCVVSFPSAPRGPVTFVVKHPGFQTKSHTVAVRPNGNLKFGLVRGETLDVFALTRTYQYVRGIAGAKVTVRGRLVGVTDQFGRLSYAHAGPADEPVDVAVEAKGYFPEVQSADVVVAGPTTLVKRFTPPDAPQAKAAVLDAQAAGGVGDGPAWREFARGARALSQTVAQALAASPAFALVSPDALVEGARRAGVGLAALGARGWRDTDLKGDVDALIQPTLSLGQPSVLELAAVDAAGRVVAAAAQSFPSAPSAAALAEAVPALTQRIHQSFPFEGAIVALEGKRVTVNLGAGGGRGLRVGETLDVMGAEAARADGHPVGPSPIARVTVDKVGETSASGTLTAWDPRASAAVGDIVVRRDRRADPASASAGPRLVVRAQNAPVARANVYWDGQWLGATDANGVSALGRDAPGRKGRLMVTRRGFAPLAQDVAIATAGDVNIALTATGAAWLRVDATPAGATVMVDGKAVGATPFAGPVPVAGASVTLEVKGPDGYAPFRATLPWEDGSLDLPGPRAVALVKDFARETRRALSDGGVTDAIARFEAVPPDHPDWLAAQQELGTLYLTARKDPARAAAAFARVTAHPAARDMSDARFLPSHAGQGVALCQWGQASVDADEKAAVTRLTEALAVLDRVIPRLRRADGVAPDAALADAAFHQALATHVLWQLSGDRKLLDRAVASWTEVIAVKGASAEGADRESKAQAYLRQARAALGGAPARM